MSGVFLVKSKTGLATGDMEIWVIVIPENLMEIPNMLMCGDRFIYVVVEGRRPLWWACGDAWHLSKLFPRKKPEVQSQLQNSKKNEIQSCERSGRMDENS